MYTCYLSNTPIFFPFLKVEKFRKPTWERLVEAVKDDTGGNNPALAQKIAKDHPGEPGNLIHQFAKPYAWKIYSVI